jgi:GMP reductase
MSHYHSEYFDYNQINLIPRKGIVNSRSECDTIQKFGNLNFKLPIVPANMESVVNEELCQKLAEQGYFYIMHRFKVDIISFIRKMKLKGLYTSISIGVNEDSYQLIKDLIDNNLIPDYITIDIAHGHSIKMEKMLKYLISCEELKSTFIIAGNISTIEGIKDLTSWGANAIKVGISNGSVCTTYPTTGYGSRDIHASIVKKLSSLSDIPIIADGAVKEFCDISKALTLGAKMVMIGGMMSGFEESPGRMVISDGRMYKEFYGSASEHSYGADGNKKNKHIEGTIKLIPYKNESIFSYLEKIKQALQSSISYGGGKDLSVFNQVQYIIKNS